MKTTIRVISLICLGLLLSACDTGNPVSDVMEFDKAQSSRAFIQSKNFENVNLEMALTSGVNVLQDMGFSINNTDLDLGLITAEKKVDAKDKVGITLAVTTSILSALSGSYGGNSMKDISKEQLIKVSLVATYKKAKKSTTLRINFHRIVWDMEGSIMRRELIEEPEIYREFYSKLSKSIFLEVNEV